MARAPQERAAQRRLAAELTRLVHGESGLHAAEAASKSLFSGNVTLRALSRAELEQFTHGVAVSTCTLPRRVVDLAEVLGLSKRAIARADPRCCAVCQSLN